MIPTPHIEVNSKDQIAKVVLMPGDPLRAKYIAEHFLTDTLLFNKVRNIFGYTGFYNGKKVSVMASGMGMPSIGIYSYELYNKYDVDTIIRLGSCGVYSKEYQIYDTVLATEAYSESTYAKVAGISEKNIIKATNKLNNILENTANKLSINLKKCRIHSTDVFYRVNPDDYKKIRDEKGCMAVEMESFALFANAKLSGKNAACLLTVSDSLEMNENITAKERERNFSQMIKIALEALDKM